MNNMELTKNDTKMLQGLSVIAMVCLHLFNRNYNDLYTPLLFINGVPVCFCLSQLSDFCVFGFAFCSGYAHMKLFEKNNYFKKRLKSLLILMINFWLILFASSIISILIGQSDFMPGSIDKFLSTMFLYNVHYNGAWWYLWAYALLVLASPLVLTAVKKFSPVLTILISFLIYCIAFFVRYNMQTDNYFLLHFGPFGMTLFEYVVGAVIAKTLFFAKAKYLLRNTSSLLKCIAGCLLVLILFFLRTFIIPNVFFAPFSGFIIIFLFSLWRKPKWIENVFLFVGNHSTNIWLTHMFFISTQWIYFAKYPLLIFLLIMVITILISIAVSFVMGIVSKALNRAVQIK